jgi:hypothetical protein
VRSIQCPVGQSLSWWSSNPAQSSNPTKNVLTIQRQEPSLHGSVLPAISFRSSSNRRTTGADAIEAVVLILAETRTRRGRLFILARRGWQCRHASHAVNDFRKIAGLEAYTPTGNVAELTARTNDEGWASTFDGWLRVSHLRPGDCVLVLSRWWRQPRKTREPESGFRIAVCPLRGAPTSWPSSGETVVTRRRSRMPGSLSQPSTQVI